MGSLRNIAVAVLAISFLTFVALFGRLPALRNTPIGFLHRLVLQYIPRAVQDVDKRLTGGLLTSSLTRFAHYLTYEQHPLVLIFFLTLLTASAGLFLHSAWTQLSLPQQAPIPLLLALPYLFTYLCVTSTASRITPSNHPTHLRLYPYDHTLYSPRIHCRTCQHLKPARSKHCSICRACISRHDHHCIWVNNCLGRDNYRWFLGLLASLGVLLLYGASLAFVLLRTHAKGKGSGIKGFFERVAMALASDAEIGAVGLLAGMTAPLAWGLFGYHVYLIWAGTTTNETQKWDELKEDMADGLVFLGKRSVVYSAGALAPSSDQEEPATDWPVSSDQVIMRTTDGEEPRLWTRAVGTPTGGVEQPMWTPCWHLREIENVYDLGFWDNIRDALGAM